MLEPVRVDLYGTEEGLLRETVKQSVILDLDGYPRSEMEVPLDLREYSHREQEFGMNIDGGPPASLSMYEHSNRPFQVPGRGKDEKEGLLSRIYSFFSGSDIEIDRYLADSADEALNEIENGSLLFEVRGKNEDGEAKVKGEPVKVDLLNRDEYQERLEIVEELAEDDEILENELLKSQESKVLGCSHYVESGFYSSPHRTWEELRKTDVEVAVHMDVGLNYPVAVGYLGERYPGESTFGYRITDEKGRVDPSKYSKEERTIAQELEDVVEMVESYDIDD